MDARVPARRLKRAVLGGGCALFAALGLVALNFSALVDYALTPSEGFSAQTPPAAPDYASAASWSALPDRDDLADRTPIGVGGIDQRSAPVDVFYLHPTSYVGSRWNGPIDDTKVNEATDRVATGIQASAFNGCCALYAPRYRQVNPRPFTHPSPDGERAIDLAFADVRRAFDAFNARRGAGRPFVVASHSQGSVLAERLLGEAISRAPIRAQLVAAYLIGGPITVDGLRERMADIPPCESPDQTGCVVAWNARGPRFVPGDHELRRPDTRRRLCTNPLSWHTDDVATPASANLGAVFLESDDPSVRKGFADARCLDGTLVVSTIGSAPRDFMSKLLDHVAGAENYHPIEYQVFFMNIRENAERRAHAMLAVHGEARAPAPASAIGGASASP